MASQSTALTKADTKKIEGRLAILKKRAEEIVVNSRETYTEACKLATECRSEIKAVGFIYDPMILSARNHMDEIKDQKAEWVNRVQPVAEIAANKAENWLAEDRRQKQAEQDAINAQRRREAAEKAEAERKIAEARAEEERKKKAAEIAKAQREGEISKREAERQKKEAEEKAARDREQAAKDAEVTKANVQEVVVQSAAPTVSGIRRRVLWPWTMKDIAKVERELLYPNNTNDVDNFPRITVKVREVKNANVGKSDTEIKAAIEAAIPGIEVTWKDAI